MRIKKLTSYQKPILAWPWYESESGLATTQTFLKARRIGGSTVAAIRAIYLAVGVELHRNGEQTRREPMDVWVVSKDFQSSKGLLAEMAEAISELSEADPEFDAEIHATTIRFVKSGKTISALPCSQQAIRGKTGAVVMDEVAFWRRMDDVYGAAKLIAAPNLKERRGYPTLLVTTPWDESSLAYRLFTDESFPFKRWSVDIYQAVRAGFPIDPERAKRELGIPELFASEYECSWAKSGSSFFPISKLRDCQEDELPRGWEKAPAVFGIDVGGGRGRDFTAAVQWRRVDDEQWVAGVRAANDLKIDEQADHFGDWILSTEDGVNVEVRVDQGIMGGALIDLLQKKLKHRRRTRIVGVSMSPADQEMYAKAGKRVLESGAMRLYTGTDAGGDDSGSRALMLELSQLKTRPGEGGRLTFATPRDSTGHRDRAWACLFGAYDKLEAPAPMISRDTVKRIASVAGRWSGMGGRGFG